MTYQERHLLHPAQLAAEKTRRHPNATVTIAWYPGSVRRRSRTISNNWDLSAIAPQSRGCDCS
jgi:hypothetical protein